MGWTLEQLRTLAALADAGTMAAAAAELGYTPGAVSQQMATLAAAAGRPLLVRVGRRVELTDDGLLLLAGAREVLAADERARSALAAPRADRRAVVTLGVFGSAASAAFGPTTALLRQRAPWVDVRAVEVDVERAIDAVVPGPGSSALDVALGLEHPDSPSPPVAGVTAVPLLVEQYAVVGAVGSLPVGTEALRGVLQQADWVLPPLDTAFGRAARTACARAGIAPSVRHTVTDTAVSLALAESGAGLTLATPLMLALRPTRCDTAPLPDPAGGGAQRRVVALVRATAAERESVRLVLAALQEAFTHLSP
ncbi:transcriptional regulator, LysR family [Quadrisphaera granulorum]|uniref:LysR family transcriptional regulator n=1 Tax=Quadrisphaera granulorum TaxID=317664 RepID=A0A315ZUN0_9ACTN|nr:LysR family transcriptional regulator [Quadrisphaera granulorum]PWJ49049.1 LysR family transcriptional regulator [Quadrisphaera granulorum]SZE98259.1 transcriptional regulator, LysR family [Quadrisphaera granulorum]